MNLSKITNYFFLVIALLVINACGSDDEAPPVVEELTLNGAEVNVQTALAINFGCGGNICNTDFILTDGTVTLDNNGLPSTLDNLNFSITAELFSPGTSFQTGTFEFDPNGEPGDFFFNIVDVNFANAGALVNARATSGSVTLEGSGSNFTITFNNVGLTTGGTVNGTFSGAFQVFP